MTRKEALMRYGEKLTAKRESYAQQCRELEANADFTQEYKAKHAEELAQECRKALEKIAGDAAAIIDAALDHYKKERERVLVQRNDQAYNLQLQSALTSLKLAAHALSDSEIEALRSPFMQDAVAMAALKACALEGGMLPIKAAKVFAFVVNPHAAKLESLKTSVLRYAASADPRGANRDDLALSFTLSYGLSSLPDDLITLDSSEVKEEQP